jgi:hypothetical protein
LEHVKWYTADALSSRELHINQKERCEVRDMTTFTTEDRERAVDVTINVEPIPFAGLVQLQDNEDREQMLRDQLAIVQAECQRLKKKLMEHGIYE